MAEVENGMVVCTLDDVVESGKWKVDWLCALDDVDALHVFQVISPQLKVVPVNLQVTRLV